MTRRAMPTFVLTICLVACTPGAAQDASVLSASHAAALADTVAAVARASETSWKLVSCKDLRPVLEYWDGSPPGLVHAHEGVLATFSDSAWTEQVRSWVCSSGSGESVVEPHPISWTPYT